jgi:hypothetical protein
VIKTIKFYTISAIIIALAVTALYYRFQAGHDEVRRVADPPAIIREIQRLNELVTVKYNVQKVIGLEEEKVPFGSEKIMIMVQATVLGGVELADLGTQDVTVAGTSNIIVRLPGPKVLHVFVSEKETKVWDRSKTWWTPWVPFNPELDQKARLAALEAVQVAAVEMGILSNAQANAETTIREFLRPLGVAHVSFETSAALR